MIDGLSFNLDNPDDVIAYGELISSPNFAKLSATAQMNVLNSILLLDNETKLTDTPPVVPKTKNVPIQNDSTTIPAKSSKPVINLKKQRIVKKPTPVTPPSQSSIYLRGFIMWFICAVFGWISIPKQFLPLITHSAGISLFLIFVTSKTRWLWIVAGILSIMLLLSSIIPTDYQDLAMYTTQFTFYFAMAITIVSVYFCCQCRTRKVKKNHGMEDGEEVSSYYRQFFDVIVNQNSVLLNLVEKNKMMLMEAVDEKQMKLSNVLSKQSEVFVQQFQRHTEILYKYAKDTGVVMMDDESGDDDDEDSKLTLSPSPSDHPQQSQPQLSTQQLSWLSMIRIVLYLCWQGVLAPLRPILLIMTVTTHVIVSMLSSIYYQYIYDVKEWIIQTVIYVLSSIKHVFVVYIWKGCMIGFVLEMYASYVRSLWDGLAKDIDDVISDIDGAVATDVIGEGGKKRETGSDGLRRRGEKKEPSERHSLKDRLASDMKDKDGHKRDHTSHSDSHTDSITSSVFVNTDNNDHQEKTPVASEPSQKVPSSSHSVSTQTNTQSTKSQLNFLSPSLPSLLSIYDVSKLTLVHNATVNPKNDKVIQINSGGGSNFINLTNCRCEPGVTCLQHSNYSQLAPIMIRHAKLSSNSASNDPADYESLLCKHLPPSILWLILVSYLHTLHSPQVNTLLNFYSTQFGEVMNTDQSNGGEENSVIKSDVFEFPTISHTCTSKTSKLCDYCNIEEFSRTLRVSTTSTLAQLNRALNLLYRVYTHYSISQHSFKSLSNVIVNASKHLEKLKKEVEKLKNIKGEKEGFENLWKTQTKSLQSLTRKYEKQTKRLSDMKEEYDVLKMRYTSLNNHENALETEMHNIEEKLRRELEEVHKEASKNEKANESKIRTLEDQMSYLRTKNQKNRDYSDQLKAKFAKFKTESNEEIEKLTSRALAAENALLSQQESFMKTNQTEKERMQSEIEDLKSRLVIAERYSHGNGVADTVSHSKPVDHNMRNLNPTSEIPHLNPNLNPIPIDSFSQFALSVHHNAPPGVGFSAFALHNNLHPPVNHFNNMGNFYPDPLGLGHNTNTGSLFNSLNPSPHHSSHHPFLSPSTSMSSSTSSGSLSNSASSSSLPPAIPFYNSDPYLHNAPNHNHNHTQNTNNNNHNSNFNLFNLNHSSNNDDEIL